jgi:hypothetical protein
MNPVPPIWNSLEVAKLLVSALTPLLLIIIGLWINRSLKRLDYLQWTNQKVTEKRIEVFEQLAPLLNDLLCYFTFVGCWKDLNAREVVERKREMDRIVHINAPLFSKEFGQRYHDFIEACYSTYMGWGKDAQLRTLSERRKEAAGTGWKSEWDDCFADEEDCSDPDVVRSKYMLLMSCFSEELGVGLRTDQVSSGQIPANIK